MQEPSLLKGAHVALTLMALPEPTFKINVELLKEWTRYRKSQPPTTPPAWLPQERKRLDEERRAFRQALGGWSPQEAARQWLAFVERHEAQLATLKRKAGKYVLTREEIVPFGWQIEILPGPASWPILSRLPLRRPYLRLLVAALNNQPRVLLAELKQLRARTKETESLNRAEEAFLKTHADPDLMATVFQRQINEERKGIQDDDDAELLLRIPKLLPTLDRPRAAGLLRQLFSIPARYVSLMWENYNDPPTRFLASEVALAMGNQLKAPVWDLVETDDPNAVRLFELLKRCFPQKTGVAPPYNYADAERNYLKCLHQERPDEWTEEPSAAWKLLAEDRVEEAIPILQAEARGTASKKPRNPNWFRRQASLQLIALGQALQRPALLQSGLDCLVQVSHDGRDDTVFHLLMQHGRLAQLEAILFAQLRQRQTQYAAARKNIRIPDDNSVHGHGSDPTIDAVSLLFELYVHAGRPSDALLLLEKAPLWSNADVAGEISWAGIKSDGRYGSRDDFGFVVACVRALVSAGRRAEALRVLQAGLLRQPTVQPLYELLMTLAPTEQALAFLDRLRSAHPLVALPLIGKALIWQRVGKLADAETALRKAITLDPWQADQAAGERRKAHALLAALLEKQGRATEAAPYQQAVAASRAEEAIALLVSAGLTQRAIAACEAVQRQFPREVGPLVALLELLREQKRVTEAQAVLRQILTLLAEGWGPNHLPFSYPARTLFGTPELQKIGEEVLPARLVLSPTKAPRHYLLGLLRREQGRHTEALTALKQATVLDPNFLAAWRALADEAEDYDPATHQVAQLAFLRLAPCGESLGGTEWFSAPPLADLAALWHLWTRVPHETSFIDQAILIFPGVLKEKVRREKAEAAALHKAKVSLFQDPRAPTPSLHKTLPESDPRTAILSADCISTILSLAN